MYKFAESLRNTIPVVMRALAQAKNSGVLRVRSDDAEAELMFFQGEVIWARSSSAKRLGEALEERGAISATDLKGVLAMQKRKLKKQPIATILLGLGLVERDVAETEIEMQALDVIRLMFEWESGEYTFERVAISARELEGVVLPRCGRVDSLLEGVGVPS